MSRPQILQVIDNKRKSHDNGTTNTTTQLLAKVNHNDGNQVEEEYLKKVDAVRCYWSKLVNEDEQQTQAEKLEQQSPKESGHGEAAKEEETLPNQIVTKENVKENHQINTTTNTVQSSTQTPEKRHFILGAQSTATSSANVPVNGTKQSDTPVPNTEAKHNPDDYCSFMPSIEIVELDGDKKATIVSAVPTNATADDTLDATEPQFDHIRYKVMKSQQLLRSNLLARNTKEAQFDGLIQYLQEYSFQELLSNNNVVIVEPVRTKIERPLAASSSSSSCIGFGKIAKDKRTTNGQIQQQQPEVGIVESEQSSRKQRTNSTSSNTSNHGGGGIKRHFFYQPVQVNRELYEEELPNPDTVRNVRKFFEEHILPTPGQGLLTTAVVTTTATATGTATITTTTTTKTTTATLTKTTHKGNGNGISSKQSSPKSRRTRKYRYLTIDTSYGHAAGANAAAKLQRHHQQQQHEEKNKNAQQSRKWDTASLSSGVSSGDLSSPCECNETDVKACGDSVECSAGKPSTNNEKFECGIHVQDIVKQHNGISGKKSRTSATGIPVRSSSVRTRSAVSGSAAYASLHRKSNKPNMYRNIYEYHAIHRQKQQADSDDQAASAADEGGNDADDDDDLFGDIDDDGNELCDTYYVSNDVLRKIRECGSSVTYYGGRVVQTNSNNSPSVIGKTLENCSGQTTTNPIVSSTKATMHNQQTMLAQTQTRARVREIETCSNAVCHAANECLASNNNSGKNNNNGCSSNKETSNNNKNHLPQQHKIYLTKPDNPQNNGSKTSQLESLANQQRRHETTMANDSNNAGPNNSYVEGGGVTFKLVKSNSCSSRLELAGTDVDIIEQPEETEVVRKMVHHFEASTKNRPTAPSATDVPVTINNQTPLCSDNRKTMTDPKPVTVNNHINVGVGILSSSSNGGESLCGQENGTKIDEPKIYQSEAKDIHLDKSVRTAVGGGISTNDMGTLNGKVCRNKNVDLAFTFVKQQQQPKSAGIRENEIGTKNHKSTIDEQTQTLPNISQNLNHTKETTKEPPSPVMTKVKDSCKLSAGNLRSDVDNHLTYAPAEQIIVPVEIHREANEHFPLARSQQSNNKSVDMERCFLPLSTTSSVTSVIDKSVVKHYVANDRSIYEKRKYDDIEFEEFEVYDPTKDFEKLIEEEEAKRHHDTTNTNTSNNNNGSCNMESQQSSNTSSMRTAKSQQTTVNGSTETETDCYDSLDDKL
ncbi:javelin isoform X2 [Musca autumnalis]